MRDAITDFQPAITSESIIERDPAKGESFGCTWTLEVFIERGLRQGIGPRPAVACHDEGRSVSFIAHPVHKIYFDQSIERRCGRHTCTTRRGGAWDGGAT